MAAHAPTSQKQAGGRYLYVLGLVAMVLGGILLLPVMGTALRPAGAVALLLGVLLAGSYFLGRLKAEMSADVAGLEPSWRKPAHGSASPGSLPVTDGPLKAALTALAQAPAVLPPDRPAVAAAPGPPPVPALPAQPEVLKAWAPAVFDRMSAQQFDAVCEALFAQGGFETRCQFHGSGGGVTIWLYSRHAQQGKDNPVAVALCKQWPGQLVGVRELHPLLELMASRQLKRGTCATSSNCSDNARKFAKYNGINLLDRAAVLDLISKRTPVQQQALLALALGNR